MKGKIQFILLLAVVAYLTVACRTSAYNGCPGCSKCGITKIQIAEFEAAIQAFQFDTSRFPATNEGLDALIHNPGKLKGWNGRYLRHSVPRDAWGSAYIYKCPGDHGPFDLYSCGYDGVERTDDDIVNWKKSQ
jgi:general secretion pathway protein G